LAPGDVPGPTCGGSAGTLAAVAVSSDSDDTGALNLAALTDLCVK